MTDDEFVEALEDIVDEAFENQRLVPWMIASLFLAGARLGRYLREKGWLA